MTSAGGWGGEASGGGGACRRVLQRALDGAVHFDLFALGERLVALVAALRPGAAHRQLADYDGVGGRWCVAEQARPAFVARCGYELTSAGCCCRRLQFE